MGMGREARVGVPLLLVIKTIKRLLIAFMNNACYCECLEGRNLISIPSKICIFFLVYSKGRCFMLLSFVGKGYDVE